VLECWSAGVLECWSAGVLECWSAGTAINGAGENLSLFTFHFLPLTFSGAIRSGISEHK
jgi:hypothetical protein